ncbi:putative carbohydrate esterase [Acorus calamus]|uniref:Carbohydrate esterase n=1 Tax=Acorus calamus TaxID=4465 RepID=A0AAV9EYP8_ACOCL|nr:putative carbohydrate esterase [Acorus calamus]
MDIFILSGQSNMSGRGGVARRIWDGVVPPEALPNPSILRFNAESQWEEAREPIHADIDAAKTCGIGPGMPFANAVLGSSSSSGRSVGLVPCAVGGTAILEWGRGSHLYEQMVRRAKESVASSPGGVIRAVLWYQGESDTDSERDADSYKRRLEKFIANVRADLGFPSLPFIQVAIASGLNELYIKKVREVQKEVKLPNVACVDAQGLPLNDDHLHLTTAAQVRLGKMLSEAYLHQFASHPS